MTNNIRIKDTNVDVWNMKNGDIVGDGPNFELSIKEYDNICDTYLSLRFVTVDGYEYKFFTKVDSIEKVEN
jgi:hypothetical protein